LQPAEDRGEHVHPHRDGEDLRQLGEVDAHAGHDVGPREHVGELLLTTRAQPLDGLGFGHPGRQHLADDAVEDDVGGVADDLRADDAERDARRSQQRDDGDGGPLLAEAREELAQRAAEVFGALRWHAQTHEAAARTARPSAATGWASHHHAAASPSCDSTISRYSELRDMSASCVPLPTIRPWSRTMMWSARRIVLTRCETMTTVASAVSDRSALRNRESVAASSAE